MPRWFKNTLLHCCILFLLAGTVNGQNYYLRKDASVLNSSLGCMQLSPSKNYVAGAAWSKTKISLKNSFRKEFMLYFDNDDNGADGIGFVLHRDSRGFATDPVSGYIGYQNITPSFTVEFDIYYNTNLNPDTKISAGQKDHIDLVKNGDVYAWPTLLSGGAVTALPNGANIEDGKCHNVVVEWDASKKVVTVFFDGYKRVTQGIDLVKDIFSNQDSVIWGFTGGTGSSKTNHYMCEGNLKFTASDTCINSGDTIQLGTSNNTAVQWKPQVRISCDNCPSPKVWPNFKTNYTAELTNGICTIRDTVEVYVTTKNFGSNKIFLPNDTNVCSFPISVKTIKGFPGYPEMYWEDNSQSIPRNITKPGTYWLQISDGKLCPKVRDTIVIGQDSLPVILFSGDSVLCNKDSGTVTLSEKNNLPVVWSDGYWKLQRTVYPGIKYTAYATSKCATDTLQFTVHQYEIPKLKMPTDTTFCSSSPKLGPVRQTGVSYKWENKDTNLVRTLSAPGTYKLVAKNICGADSTTTKVTITKIPTISLLADTLLCGIDSGYAIATATSASITWGNGSTSNPLIIHKNNWYSVSAYNYCGGASKSFYVKRLEKPAVIMTADTIFCSKPATIGALRQVNHTYLWDNGDTSLIRSVNQSGTYQLIASGRCGSDTDKINVVFKTKPTLSVVYDSFLCANNTGTATVTSSDPGWKWSNGSNAEVITTNSARNYYVTVQNICGSDSVGFYVNHYNLPALDLPTDTISCTNPVLIGVTTETGVTYTWDDGSNLIPRSITQAGVYSINATGKCQNSASIQVAFDSVPRLSIGADTFLCPGAEYTAKDKFMAGSATYRWQDGSTQMPRIFNSPGVFNLSKTNICGSTSDQLIILDSCNFCKIWVPNAFSPAEGSLVNTNFRPVLSCVPEEYHLRIFNRWGEKLFETKDYKKAWDGMYKGNKVPAGVYVAVVQALVVEGNSTRRREVKTDLTVLD